MDETAQPSQDPNVNPQANNEIDQSNVNQATDNQLPNNAQDNAQAQSNDTEQNTITIKTLIMKLINPIRKIMRLTLIHSNK